MALHKAQRSPESDPRSDLFSESQKTQLSVQCSAKKYIK